MFIHWAGTSRNWVLNHFGWLFSWSSFLFLIILIVAYCSSFGATRIGGEDATPILSKWRWFSITLCTTIATGILFWGMAEPLYHLHSPPDGLGVDGSSKAASIFAISTLFMHWSLTPYGVYTIGGLVFAISYYNLKQEFSLSAVMYPLFGDLVHHRASQLVDVISLYALVLGMSASLGAGIFAIAGGLDLLLGVPKTSLLLGVIAISIVCSFIVSAISGLHKGIRILSDINAKAFIVLAIFVVIAGPSLYILEVSGLGLWDYISTFFARSTNVGSRLDSKWQQDWTIFYLANWFAWTPITALFLGRIAVGYTVRQFIVFNLVLPSIFTIVWMSVFGGFSMWYDQSIDGGMYALMNTKGVEVVMFTVLDSLPLGRFVCLATLIMIIISYVTAADSNVSAMSAISTDGIKPENPEATLWIKVVWGSIIGATAWLMITTSGIDGIRMLSVLGGFPALFLIILVAMGLIKMIWNTSKKGGI